MDDINKPFASVCMITYNHEQFINEAIEGVLSQCCNFSFELIIGEDHSSDNTRKKCLQYAEEQPELIKLNLNKTNFGMLQNLLVTMEACTGNYISICEGDDYWTNPYKLQKQVDFLEANPEYSVCFHRYKILDDEAQQFRDDGCGFLFNSDQTAGVDIDHNLFFQHWVTQPVTMVFRKSRFDLSLVSKYRNFRDIHLLYHLLKAGKGYLFAFNGGVYREHNNGLHSKKPLKHQAEIGITVAKELFLENGKEEILKTNYLRTLQWGISCYSTNHYGNRKLLSYIWNHFYYSNSLKRFLKNLHLFILSVFTSVKKSETEYHQTVVRTEKITIDEENNKLNQTPMVSIFIVTYNHEKYIAQALDSAMMQKTNFDFEIIIGEDCSSDSTKSIIQEYKSKYPEIIRVFYQEKNVGRERNTYEFTLPKCRGKYIAYLEGDDYWTDPFKLQKQIDFLEANPDYVVCFHRCKIYDQEETTFRNDGCGFLFQDINILGIDIDTELFLNHWITQSLTMVYRKESFNFSVLPKYKHFRDMHHIYYLLKNSKGHLFAFEGGVYREHFGGLHSKRSLKFQSEIGVAVAKELYLKNRKDKLLKNNYLKTLQWGISCFSTNHYGNLKLLTYIFSHLYYSGSVKRFIKNSYSFFKN